MSDKKVRDKQQIHVTECNQNSIIKDAAVPNVSSKTKQLNSKAALRKQGDHLHVDHILKQVFREDGPPLGVEFDDPPSHSVRFRQVKEKCFYMELTDDTHSLKTVDDPLVAGEGKCLDQTSPCSVNPHLAGSYDQILALTQKLQDPDVLTLNEDQESLILSPTIVEVDIPGEEEVAKGVVEDTPSAGGVRSSRPVGPTIPAVMQNACAIGSPLPKDLGQGGSDEVRKRKRPAPFRFCSPEARKQAVIHDLDQFKERRIIGGVKIFGIMDPEITTIPPVDDLSKKIVDNHLFEEDIARVMVAMSAEKLAELEAQTKQMAEKATQRNVSDEALLASQAASPVSQVFQRPCSAHADTSHGNVTYTWDGTDSGEVHVPDWKVLLGTRLNDPLVCMDYMIKSIPPAEQMFIQEQDTSALTDHIALGLTIAQTRLTELCRRTKIDAQKLQTAMSEKVKYETELKSLKVVLNEVQIKLLREKSVTVDCQARAERLEKKCADVVAAREAADEQLSKIQNTLYTERETFVSARREHERILSGMDAELQRARKDMENVKVELLKNEKVSKTMTEDLALKEIQLKAASAEVAAVKQKSLEAVAAERVVFQRELQALKGQLEAEITKNVASSSSQVQEISRLREEKKWLMEEGVLHIFKAIKGDQKFNDAKHGLVAAADLLGHQDGMVEGFECGVTCRNIKEHPSYRADAYSQLIEAYETFSDVEPEVFDELYDMAEDEDLSRFKTFFNVDEEQKEGDQEGESSKG